VKIHRPTNPKLKKKQHTLQTWLFWPTFCLSVPTSSPLGQGYLGSVLRISFSCVLRLVGVWWLRKAERNVLV